MARQFSKDVVIQGTMIPKGTALFIIPAVFHQDPTIWGDNYDEFDPHRWDQLSGEAAHPSVFMSFSRGPRICIGKAMAMMQFKVIMVEMVSRFDFQLPESGS